jgi:signal transduction histidine kinase
MARPQRIAAIPDPLPELPAGYLPADTMLVDPSGRVLAMSAETIRLFGRKLTDLADRVESSDGFPLAPVQEALARAKLVWARTSQLVTLEREHRRYFLVRTEIVDTSSGERMMATVVDLTALLRESDVPGDLIRQVRHDLRGPLTSMQGGIDLLRSGRMGNLQEGQAKLLDLMDKAAKQLDGMISGAPTPGKEES